MKKVVITQDLCRMVELMLKGGAQQKEVGERLGISKATVSRIKTAGYDAEQYRKNTTERVEKENMAEMTEEEKQILGIRYPLTVEKVEMSEGGVSVTARQAEEQVEGQMEMELPLPVTITVLFHAQRRSGRIHQRVDTSREDPGGGCLMEEYVIGFRAIGSHMAFISEVLPGKDGDKVYIYGTNTKKKAMKFSWEEAEQIVKQSKIPDVTMMKA